MTPTSEPVTLSAEIDLQERLHWRVRDTGAALPDNEHETVFDAFFQSRRNGAAPNASQGSGLELAICRQIMRELGGDLIYQPHPQGGGVFDFWLPHTTPERSDPRPFEASQKKAA